jgi:hypothetical protein
MKILIKSAALAFALGLFGAAAYAQSAKLRVDSLDRLEDKALKVVDVALDEKLIGMAARIVAKADPKDPDAEKAAEILAGIKEVYVRSYEFEREGEYLPADVESIRSQVTGPGWSRLVGVRSKRAGENAEVYVLTQGDKMLGLAIIAANPKELTVVNIVGSVDVERLSEIDADILPRVELRRDPKP